MRKIICAVAVVSMFLFLVSGAAWGLNLKPGKYQITTKVEMAGMPGMIPPQTTTQCMTDQDPVPDTSTADSGCEMKDMKTKGDTITYTMECIQQGAKMTSTGKMTYHGDSFEGSTQMVMGPEAGGMTMNSEINGKRIGDCN